MLKGMASECDDQSLIAHTLRGDGFDASEDGTGRGMPLIAVNARQNPVFSDEVTAGPLDQDRTTHAISMATGVRRLTPIECERLMGFPDDYTRIPWRNKSPDKCPDGPRYKALGNSMAVNCMEWIGERIATEG